MGGHGAAPGRTPGLTCFWQIGGGSEIDFKDRLHLDVLYIETKASGSI